MKNKFFDNKIKVVLILFAVLFCLIFCCLGLKDNTSSSRVKEFVEFVMQTEAKTFDLRQNILSKGRMPSKDIVVVGIDNVSHEYLTSHFGSWPLPRSVYSDFVDYVEGQNPLAIGIDVLFVGSWHKNKENDLLLAESFKKYENVVGAIYFDDYSREARQPLVLPHRVKSKLQSDSKIAPYSYNNLRELYPEFLQSAKNLGHLNLERSRDGVIRTLPLFVSYNNDGPYANFALKILTEYIQQREGGKISEYKIDKNNNLVLDSKKIPLLPTTESVLNWYETDSLKRYSSFEYVSFKDVFRSMNAKKMKQKPVLSDKFFKDKIVVLGFTADSLADLKTVPTTKLLPGVEIYATFLSNVIDGSIIKKVNTGVSFAIVLFLICLSGVVLFRIKSLWINLLFVLAFISIYIWLSFFVMKYFFLWIPLFVPIMAILFTFVIIISLKYFFKSEDYEQVYKLVTHDSLTGLYNHRFFQDQMRINYEYCKRYGGNFSLIMIDIDKFKSFNDKYGHQVGDEVLRQVSDLLKTSVRKADIVCRYGGEEIAIVLPHTSNVNAFLLADKLCKIVAENGFVLRKDTKKELTVNVTVSLGVSTYPESADCVTDLVEIADKIMYNAKQTGRNKVGSL